MKNFITFVLCTLLASLVVGQVPEGYEEGQVKASLAAVAEVAALETSPGSTRKCCPSKNFVFPTGSYLVLLSGDIGSIDVDTAVYTQLVSARTLLTDIALSPCGELYVCSFSILYSVNLAAGTVTPIGPFVNSQVINGLAFGGDKNLYATGLEGGFYKVDVATGTATLIRIIPGFISSGDLVWNPICDEFLATSSRTGADGNDQLFSIKLNGSSSIVGDIGIEDVFGLLFEKGILYGYTPATQFTINSKTGAPSSPQKQVIGVADVGDIAGATSPPAYHK